MKYNQDLCSPLAGELSGEARLRGVEIPTLVEYPPQPPFSRQLPRKGGAISALIVTEARSWLGTPYHHQASVKGVGADCLGLIRGVWRAVRGDEPEAMPAYTSEWAETGGVETLLEAARRHLVEKTILCSPLVGELAGGARLRGVKTSTSEQYPPQPPFGRQLPHKGGAGFLTPGDILLFRMRPRALVKHIGIYVGGGYFIHAYEHAGVVEQELTDFWRSKIAAVFGWG